MKRFRAASALSKWITAAIHAVPTPFIAAARESVASNVPQVRGHSAVRATAAAVAFTPAM